jgi:hypothetical protein
MFKDVHHQYVILDMQKYFTQSVIMFKTYVHTELHVPHSSDSLFMAVKLKAGTVMLQYHHAV